MPRLPVYDVVFGYGTSEGKLELAHHDILGQDTSSEQGRSQGGTRVGARTPLKNKINKILLMRGIFLLMNDIVLPVVGLFFCVGL